MARKDRATLSPASTGPAGTAGTAPAPHPVRLARVAVGYTQQSLADAVGVTRQTIIAIEAGDYAPSVVLAIRVARLCACAVEDLWGPAADAVTTSA
jgi:putative transcriptional regulator